MKEIFAKHKKNFTISYASISEAFDILEMLASMKYGNIKNCQDKLKISLAKNSIIRVYTSKKYIFISTDGRNVDYDYIGSVLIRLYKLNSII